MEDLESLQKYWNAQYEETINSQTQLYIAICDDKEEEVREEQIKVLDVSLI